MLTKVTSSDNNRVRLVRKLRTRKGRSEEKRFTAEGRNLVSEILEKDIGIDFIMVSDSLINDKNSSDAEMIREYAASDSSEVLVLNDRAFSKLTDAENGIKMLAVARMPERGPEQIASLDPGSNILVLDRIQDPGNMGTLVRTAAAAGYSAILCMSGTVDIYSPKVLRATAGMIFDIPVIYITGYDSLRKLLKENGKRIAVTAVDSGTPYYKADLRENTALVIGNEGRGVSDEVLEMADVRVNIPMKGGTESLNAAVAAAVLMYESVRE